MVAICTDLPLPPATISPPEFHLNYHLVGPPLANRQSWIRQHIVSICLITSSLVRFAHSRFIAVRNFVRLRGRFALSPQMRCLIIRQIASIGLRSGEHGGKSILRQMRLARAFSEFCATCAGQLSSTKTISGFLSKKSSNRGRICWQ